jgi:hypothetical protein
MGAGVGRSVFMTATAALVLAGCSKSPQAAPAQAGSDVFKADSLAASVPVSCEGGGIATNDQVAVSKEIALLEKSAKGAKPLINERLSSALGTNEPLQVDQSETLKEVCRQKAFSHVQVVDPDSLSYQNGWVPVSALREIKKDAGGKRQYTEADFNWDLEPATKLYKAQLVAGVNRIIRENDRCESVDTGTLSPSRDRSTKAHPVFFVTCNPNSGGFNVWFSPEEATNKSHSFAAIANVDEGDAIVACKQAAKEAANHPQSVDFSEFLDVSFVPYPNGNSRVISSFTAKNGFGVEDKFRIECFFEGRTLTEREIEKSTS